jgi:DNA replication ATP-dependent helicase Dna2
MDTNKKYVIGITACTKDAIANLMERISYTRKNYKFTIFSMIENLKRDGIEVCEEGENISEKIAGYSGPIVIGGTVWDWHKVRKTIECDIIMIDEGSQVSKKKKIFF